MSFWDALFGVVFEPGFFSSAPVHTAMIVGGGAAVVSGVVGVFTVMREQSFAGHALAEVSSAGGSASFLFGINPLAGFLTVAALAAAGMEVLQIRRARERDLMTGIVLGAGLGVAALFLYLDVTSTSTTGAAITVMFGSMFSISPAIIPLALTTGVVTLFVVALLYRPLLLSTLDPELARVRGVPVLATGILHLVVVGLAVSLSAITVGAILSTALLIGPAAIGLRLARRPATAVLVSVLIAVGMTWSGILLAYDSYYWIPGHSWPVSFFVVTLIFVAYLAAFRSARTRLGEH